MLNRILNKIDHIDERINSVDVTLAAQEQNLAHHMRRTELAEKSIEILAAEMKPIRKHVGHVEGGFKVIGGISILMGITLALLQFFGVVL